MTHKKERREFSRVAINIEISLRSGGEKITSRRTRNLSMKGVYVPCRQGFPAGSKCRVTLFLGEPEAQLRIEAKAMVVRQDQGGMAIQFLELPLESYQHLRQLLLYNAPDSPRFERELKAHIGLKKRPKPAS